jgi:hypothetical protein
MKPPLAWQPFGETARILLAVYDHERARMLGDPGRENVIRDRGIPKRRPFNGHAPQRLRERRGILYDLLDVLESHRQRDSTLKCRLGGRGEDDRATVASYEFSQHVEDG